VLLNLSKILAELKTERRKLDAAIRALQALAGSSLPQVQLGRRASQKRKALAVRARSSAAVKTMNDANLLMFPSRRRNRRRSAAEKGLSGGGRHA
jgi:hypothetical protein